MKMSESVSCHLDHVITNLLEINFFVCSYHLNEDIMEVIVPHQIKCRLSNNLIFCYCNHCHFSPISNFVKQKVR